MVTPFLLRLHHSSAGYTIPGGYTIPCSQVVLCGDMPLHECKIPHAQHASGIGLCEGLEIRTSSLPLGPTRNAHHHQGVCTRRPSALVPPATAPPPYEFYESYESLPAADIIGMRNHFLRNRAAGFETGIYTNGGAPPRHHEPCVYSSSYVVPPNSWGQQLRTPPRPHEPCVCFSQGRPQQFQQLRQPEPPTTRAVTEGWAFGLPGDAPLRGTLWTLGTLPGTL